MNLNLDGQSIERIDFGVTLITDSASELRVEIAFTFRMPDRPACLIVPVNLDKAFEVLASILHETIGTTTAHSETGTLLLDFDHGAQIEVLQAVR